MKTVMALLVFLWMLSPLSAQFEFFGPRNLPDRLPTGYTPNLTQRLFLANQLLDNREVYYLFSKNDEFWRDLGFMIERQKMAATSPFIQQTAVFPCNEVVKQLIDFNRDYDNYIEECNQIWRQEIFKTIHEENEELLKIWQHLFYASDDRNYIYTRRLALKELKAALDKIDPTWYDRGIMPPHVPIWRFTYIR